MRTECTGGQIEFKGLGRRKIQAAFDGGHLSSDGGVLLLREVDERLGLTRRFARCFTNHRDPGRIEHSVLELARQRVFGLALGHEDFNDHDASRAIRCLRRASRASRAARGGARRTRVRRWRRRAR